MSTFDDLRLTDNLYRAIAELGFEYPTPIQAKSCSVVLSGKDVVGIAQTGTGKTFAYLFPLLRDLKYSDQIPPRILILVPTRELVLQVVEEVKKLTKYMTVRTLGVYGGTNINTQKKMVAEGCDVLVATPGRLYDLALTGVLSLKAAKKLVIDEVDVMLDLGFRFQLTNIFDILPQRRQNIMYSATMTDEVDALIDDFFIKPRRVSIAVSGTPLHNIAQQACFVPNFYTKVNLLKHLISDRETFSKVLVFVATKKLADRLFETLEEEYGHEACVLHSNKTQNYRIRSLQQFEQGENRLLITTDVMARGIDIANISHVVNFDTPSFAENYMHRIGRTGRAEAQGNSLIFYTDDEEEAKIEIEMLMDYEIPEMELPEEVEISERKIPEERPREVNLARKINKGKKDERGAAFHEKKQKNTKTNQGGSYLRKMKTYKKPKTRGDKNANRRR